MNPLEVVREARRHLEQSGRVSYRMLRRQFELDDDALEELIEELVDIQRVAVREDRALAWLGDAAASGPRLEALPSPRERDPRAYTPKHLADRILQSKSALEGERKQVTVLFADVKGSVELAEQLDPEEWHGILDRFFQILADGVHRFEGQVNQYLGDGIMALFGAPIAHEDHAQRACYAALYLCDELRRYGDELRLERGLSFAVRIGINSGEVVVGKIGDDLRMDYTAQGHAVNLAARMQQIAEPGKVYLTEHTARLVEGFFELRDLGESALPGTSTPLRIHELQGVGPMRTRLDVARARGFSRFVGRADEMAGLEAALKHAIDGSGQVVGVVGEAGVGKSRLCLEFVQGCRPRKIPVFDAHCPAHGKAVPLLPLLELLRSFFDIAERDGDREARRKIAGELLLLDREFDATLPLVFDFLGVPDPERPAARIEPDARQRQLFAFVRRLVQARSEREPTVLLIDDLHWVDPGSDEFVAQLVEAVSATRTLLLVNFRPEYHADWMSKSYYEQLPLVPLGLEEIGELVGHLLGNDPSVAALPELIRARTGGNPFFIEEVVQSLAEAGSLQGTRGAYRLTKPLEALEVPSSVQAVLAARIDRLPEREKDVLRTAAVIGLKVPETVLARVVQLPERELTAALAALEAAEFLLQETLYPDVEYRFKHPLTQNVAYDAQLSERRAKLHAEVAGALEDQSPTKLDQQAALLADHWERAGERLSAARWHARAAAWAGDNDPREALTHWRKVRELLEDVPESPELVGLGLQARTQLLWQGWRLGISAEEVGALVSEGRALAERLGDVRAHVGFLIQAMIALANTGQIERGREVADGVLRLTETSDDPEMQGIRVMVSMFGEEPPLEEVVANYDRALAILSSTKTAPLPAGVPSGVMFVVFKGITLAAMGRLDDATDALERAIAEAREENNLPFLATAHGALVQVAELRGDPEAALRHGRRAVEIEEEVGSRAGLTMAYGALGRAWMVNGDRDQAVAALSRAISLGRGAGAQAGGPAQLPWLVSALLDLVRVELDRGDAESARELFSEALGLVQLSERKLAQVPTELVRAELLLRAGGPEDRSEIETSLERASTLIEELGARAYTPELQRIRAELARRDGGSEGNA